MTLGAGDLRFDGAEFGAKVFDGGVVGIGGGKELAVEALLEGSELQNER